MKNALQKFMAGLVAIPGHSLLLLAVVLVFFGAVGFVPSGLAWVLRVSGVLLLVLSAKLAWSDLPAITDWLVTSPLAWYGRLARIGVRHAPSLRRFEVLLAAAVVLPALVHFGQSVRAMSGASLRVDEIGSVLGYSSRGPLVAMTKYNRAKNHIFFSVVNSVTPGSASLDPVRARFWSFLAVGISLILLLLFFWRLGSPLAGAIAFAIPALNFEHLSKVLEARGYGFVALAAVVGLAALHGFLRGGRSRNLWILGASTALGTWTLPFYVVFGGALMLLLFLIKPSKSTFLAGFVTGLAILTLYSPVLMQLSRVASGYEENYGKAFESLVSVLDAIRLAVPPALVRVDGIVFLCAVLLLFAVPLILRKHRPENNISLQIAAVLVLAFYLFCLVLATPPPRITAFLAMPVAFVAGMVACQILTFPALSPVRLLVAAALASIFFLSGKSAVKTFTFQPDQRWRDAAVAVRSLFPGGVEVDTSGYRNMMAAYLGEKFQVQDRIPDARELQGGNRLLFSSAHYRMHTPVDRAALYPGLELLAVRFPLNDSQEQTLYLHVPAGFLIRNIQIGEGQVGVPAQIPAAARIKILLPAASRSLHLLFHGPVEKLALSADSSFRLTKSGNLVSLSLPENAREVELQFPQETGAILESAWAYPKGF